MSEKHLLNAVSIYFTELGGRIFRNNIGMAYAGRGKPYRAQMPVSVRIEPGDVVLRQAVPIKYGLHVGSGDSIGWRPVVITPEMVGTTIAQFCSVESKYGSTATTPEQKNWCDVVNRAGGYAKIIHSIDELK